MFSLTLRTYSHRLPSVNITPGSLDTMRIISIALALAFAANINDGAVAFLAGPDGNNDLMKSAVEKALLTDIKPLVDTDSGAFPPLRNQILGTEVPVSRGLLKLWFSSRRFPPTNHGALPPSPFLNHYLQCMMEYWSRPDIHTFGNVGFGGALHAAMAPIATKVRYDLVTIASSSVIPYDTNPRMFLALLLPRLLM